MIKISKIIATFFGLGYMPFAPGTFGALGGWLISCFLIYLGLDYYTFHLLHVGLVLLSFFAGNYACQKLDGIWGHDPSKVVIDETMGFWVSIIFLPLNYQAMICGFILFRFFDIVKPFGIRKIDNMNKTYTVMLDDLIAGIYANLILQFVFWIVL